MNTLAEKYRPKSLAEIRGQSVIVKCLRAFVAKPTSKAFLFTGAPGTGKTSTGYALAKELGLNIERREWSGLYEIPSGGMTADSIRDLFRNAMQCIPWEGSGWKLIIANEADTMSKAAEVVWLDILEHLPSKVVVVFTTNEKHELTRRFIERCECHTFKAPVRSFGDAATAAELAAQELIAEVWRAELGHNHAPKLAELDGVTDCGSISFRAVLNALEPLIRAELADVASAPKVKAVKLPAVSVPVPVPVAPVVTPWVDELADSRASLAAMFARKGLVIA